MFQRLLYAGIISFWLFMTGALVQLWVNPAENGLLTVPVDHIARQMFHHEQTSNLSVSQNGRRIGSLMLQPRRFDDRGVGVIDFSGSLMLDLPFMSEQPFSWRGTAELHRDLSLRLLRIHIDAHGPKIATDLEIDPDRNVILYRIGHHGEAPYESTLPLDQRGMREALESFGIDPMILKQIPGASGVAGNAPARSGNEFSLTARRSEIDIQGERAQTFRVTARQGGTNMAEADISNLGQILSVKTIFGFNFQPEQ